jgi:mRNA-degrading endonuclease RelE of RelBE toxin-antitoxin system
MSTSTILKIHPRADFAIDYLAPVLQKITRHAIEELQQQGSKARQVQKLMGVKNLFLMQPTSDLVIAFSVKGRTVTILDVLERDKLERQQRFYEETK